MIQVIYRKSQQLHSRMVASAHLGSNNYLLKKQLTKNANKCVILYKAITTLLKWNGWQVLRKHRNDQGFQYNQIRFTWRRCICHYEVWLLNDRLNEFSMVPSCFTYSIWCKTLICGLFPKVICGEWILKLTNLKFNFVKTFNCHYTI